MGYIAYIITDVHFMLVLNSRISPCFEGQRAERSFIPSARAGGPRAAILADKRLKTREITHLCTRDIAAAVCVIGKEQIIIISAYLVIDFNVRMDALIKVLEYRQEKRLGMILAADSNAHSTLWGHSANPTARPDSRFF